MRGDGARYWAAERVLQLESSDRVIALTITRDLAPFLDLKVKFGRALSGRASSSPGNGAIEPCGRGSASNYGVLEFFKDNIDYAAGSIDQPGRDNVRGALSSILRAARSLGATWQRLACSAFSDNSETEIGLASSHVTFAPLCSENQSAAFKLAEWHQSENHENPGG